MTKQSLITITIVVLLIVGLIVSIWINFRQKDRIVDLKQQLINAPDSLVKEILVKDTEIKYRTKWKTNVIKKVPEGYVKFDMAKYQQTLNKIKQLKRQIGELKKEEAPGKGKENEVYSDEVVISMIDALQPEKIKVEIVNRGWVLRPNFGLGFDTDLGINPALGLKFFFVDRYNVGIYSSLKHVGIGFGRHLDDIIPIFERAELRLIPGLGFNGDFKIWTGLTVDL